MTIDGIDALEWKPPPRPLPKGAKRQRVPVARYNLYFEELEAITVLKIPLADYQAMPGTPYWTTPEQPYSKCDVIMFYRYHRALDALSMGMI